VKTIEIPVLADTDINKIPIGRMILDQEALPKDPKFCFALGYIKGPDEIQLLHVFISPDENYFEFLKRELGK
jgi:hypothetical protein